MLREYPATIGLIVINVIVFGITYLHAGTFGEPEWTKSLFDLGALFNPLTLSGEWYRVFASMFLHGHLIHIGVNMLALFSAGRDVETAVGTPKFLALYFISGIGSAICSLYFSLFTIGVGASGAIFGLFGFSVVLSLVIGYRQGRSVTPILLNFLVFIVINLALGEAFHADHAAHFGGLSTGAMIAALSIFFHADLRKLKLEWMVLLVLVALFFLLPKSQVQYYGFFRQVIETEQEGARMSSMNLSDADFLSSLERNKNSWDSALQTLTAISVPEELQKDAAALKRYIGFRKIENDYRIRVTRDEIYILMDSLEAITDSIRTVQLEHPVPFIMHESPEQEPQTEEESAAALPLIQVWYDSNWVETAGPSVYYRIGARDSLGRWQGRVTDFYADGKVQMKGIYKNDKRDGVFLYYSHHDTYTSAGRYVDNRSVGKWQNFHHNGKLQSEVVYLDRPFVKNAWDSAGTQLVKNGDGIMTEYYASSVMKEQGQYINGYKEGIWMGWHENAQIHFKEQYSKGILVFGKSRSSKGREYIYDGSTLFPFPEGGYEKLKRYIAGETGKYKGERVVGGTVKMSFRVTRDGVLTDFEIDRSAGSTLDTAAIGIIKKGPSWRPARLYGYQPVDGFAWVDVDF